MIGTSGAGAIERFWRPTVLSDYDSPKSALAASALRTTLAGLLLWLVLQFGLFIPFLVVKKAATFGLSLALLLSALASLYYLRRGRVNLAGGIVVCALWLLAATDAVLSGGISSHAFVGLLAVTVLTAWLFDYEVTLISAGLFLGLTLSIALLENAGVRLPRYFPGPPIVIWSMLCLYLALAILPLSRGVRALRQALGETQGLATFNRALRDSLTAHIAVIDSQGVIVATNRAWDQFALENGGSLPEKYGLGASYLDACAKAASTGDPLARQALEGIRAVLEGGLNSFYLEYPCDSPSEKRWFAMHATRLSGSGGSLVVSHESISGRMRAEKALRESEERYRTLADAGQTLIWTAGLDQKCDYFNPVWLDFTGRTLEQELGDGWLEGVHPDDLERCVATYSKAFERREQFSMAYRLRRHDGEYRWIQDDGSPRYNSVNDFIGYIGACLDITERKHAEEALKKSEDQLRGLNEELERRVAGRTRDVEDARRVALSMMQDANLQRQSTEEILRKLAESNSSLVMLWQAVENSPTIVMITDTEANIQYVNPKFVEVTGYSVDEALGKNPRILKSGQHPLEFYQHLWTTIKAGKTWRGEFCNRKKGGELYWESASISPVRAANGEVLQFLAIKEDVSEIKRTAEELMRAKEAADAASQAKSAFLASMSHEIRTPLNAILGYSQLSLRDDTLGARSRESLQVINRSGEHLLGLINDVLEVSKIEAGRVGLEPAEFDLHAMLDDLSAMFRLPTLEKGLGFEVAIAKDLPRRIIADEGKTRQVLVNLLGNAVKFTKQGHIRVGAVVNRAESGQLWLAVEVEDTGSGIAPEEMGQLFRYFEQTRSGRETQSGTGLGLVISKEYASRMGGDISVASEPGKGTAFLFEIPIALGADKPPGESPDARRVVGLAPGQEPIRVLVADDQDSNRGWLSALLETIGLEVREARNGQEALEIWQTWRPELILMDMRMPLMDGYEATRRIRSATGGDSTVIIALTASTFDERMTAIKNAGVDDLVCKPFKERQIFDEIRKHLGVRYRYEESAELARTEFGEPVFPTAFSLSGLPDELLANMRQAILDCDMDGFLQLLPQVAEQDPSVVLRLRTLAEKYDYDALARIVSETE